MRARSGWVVLALVFFTSNTLAACSASDGDDEGAAAHGGQADAAPTDATADSSSDDAGLATADSGLPVGDSGSPTDDSGSVGDAGVEDACATIPPPSVTLEGDLPGSIHLGDGFFTARSQPLSSCITGSEATKQTQENWKGEYSVKVIEDARLLRQELGLAANASFESGLFSASASANYAHSSTTSSYSTYLLIEASVRFETTTQSTPKLTDDALAKLKANPASFVAGCGDQFIHSVTYGGRYRAVLRCDSLSEQSQTELLASFSGGYASFEAGVDASKAITLATSHFSCAINVLQEGGPPIAGATDISTLFAQADTFMKGLKRENAVPLQVQTHSYYELANFPACIALPDFATPLRNVDRLAKERDRAIVIRNDITRRLTMGGRLVEAACDANKKAMTDRRDEIDAYITRLDDAAEDCRTLKPTCSGALSNPPVLEMPPISKECGPYCASGTGTTADEFDRLGYCTRCRWTTRPSVNTQIPTSSKGWANACINMRPTANVLVRMRHDSAACTGASDSNHSWIIAGLETQGATYGFDVQDASRSISRSNQGGYNGINWQYETFAADDGRLDLGVYCAHCQVTGAGGVCTFEKSVAEVCDRNSSNCSIPLEW